MPADIKDDIAKVIAPFLSCEEFYARYEAVRALGALKSASSSPLLSSVAADVSEDIDVRMDAVESLVKIGDPESYGAITLLLRDESADIRLCAIRALGSMEVKSATEEIIAQLTGGQTDMISDDEFDWDPQWDIQLEAVRALGNVGDEKAVSPIIRLYEEEISYDLSEYVFKALCRIGSSSAIRFLAKTLDSGAPQERRLIVQVIAENENVSKEMKNELEKALVDEDPSVRAAAAAIAATDERGGVAALENSLTDSDPAVRASALRSLAKTGAEGIEEKIGASLEDLSPVVRAQGAMAARGRPFEKVYDKLLSLMDDNVDEVASHAARTVASFNVGEAAEPLARIALDNKRSPYMRIVCVNLIASHFIEAAAGLLPSPLDVEPRQVSISVASCLLRCFDEEEINYLVNDLRELAGMNAQPEQPGDREQSATEPDEMERSVKIGKKTRMVVRSPGETPGALKAEDLIRVLSGSDHPKIKAILAQCLTLQKSTIAAAAARAFADMGATDCGPELGGALDHRSPHVRSEAAQALGGLRICDGDISVKLGELATSDPDRMVREKSMSALGSIEANAAHEYLQKGLADPEPGVRQAAVIALGNRRDDRAIAPLIAQLFNYADFTHLRPDMYEALKKLDLAKVKRGLEEVLANEERHLDHWVAIQGLGAVFA